MKRKDEPSPGPNPIQTTNSEGKRVFNGGGDDLIVAVSPVHWKGKSAKIYLNSDVSRFLFDNKICKLEVITHAIGGAIVLRPLRPEELVRIYDKELLVIH